MLGSTKQIATILDETEPDEVVIAIPSAPGTLRAKVVAACREREIRVRTLPTVFELLRGGVQLNKQLREVQVEDVLGRDPIVVELDRVGAYLRDRIVLVTGAGGSIGSELCRQIARVGPRLLVMLDHAEDNLFEIDREMVEERHFTSVESVLADCKEPHRMLEVMQRFKPSVVFHAAAYKHVPLMEANPLEAVRNNAIATRITAETAAASRVERFVLISTDKAVNPKTVMGASKAMAEWIVEAAGHKHPGTRFASVRFGNVLASSGSVVPIFRSQIERGGPVTVTHPEMTRYFMTIPEAVQLVIRAGDIGAGKGEVFVLDMGEPVKIVDLAHNMIRLAGYEPEADIAVEFTKPRPGEKLHEELFGAGEKRAADRGEADPARRARDAARPRLGRGDAELARAPGAGRRRGESGRARGRDDHRAGWRRGDGRLRRVASRSHSVELIKEIGAFAGLAAFLGLAVLALLSFTQGRDIRRLREWAGSAPERDAERKESTSAAAAQRAEELRKLEEARTAEQQAVELREERRAAARGGPARTDRGASGCASASPAGARLAEPRWLIGDLPRRRRDRRRGRLCRAERRRTTARARGPSPRRRRCRSRGDRGDRPQRHRGPGPGRPATATRSSARASSSARSPTAAPASPTASSCSSAATPPRRGGSPRSWRSRRCG